MTLITLSPLLILILGALIIWALNERVRTFVLGLIALGCSVFALGLIVAAPMIPVLGVEFTFIWSTLNDQPLPIRFASTSLSMVSSMMLLLAGSVTAGGLAWTLGRATRAFGLVFSGLLILVLGGLITMGSADALGSITGLSVAWLGGTIMQQATTVHNRDASFSGLSLLVLATALLLFGAVPQLSGQQISPTFWLLGCASLMVLAPRWGTAPTTPLLIRAPVTALGLPVLGAYLFVRYATETSAAWQPRITISVLAAGIVVLVVAALNALVALRIAHAFAWQLMAQLALPAIVFGTGRPEAGPMAAGLLIHAIVTHTSIALAIGQFERATRSDVFATLPPLPQPLRRAGLAYGLAAASCAGIPPLLGYALRRVVLILAGIDQPWLPPLLLAASTLLALSYVPTLVAFFRRPAFKSPIAAVEQRGGGWPLALMGGLLLGGLIPDTIWQVILGDPGVQAQIPPNNVIISTAITTLLTLIVLGLINRAVRHARPAAHFTGGEPLDEEPGWTLPFMALRRTLRPLIVPERVPGQTARQWTEAQRERLTELRQTLERRYYLAVVVVSLIAVLLLAT